jgi:hypothetical protein
MVNIVIIHKVLILEIPGLGPELWDFISLQLVQVSWFPSPF